MALEDKFVNPLTDFGFKKLFGANFSLEDRQAYEDSLKYYRDLKNVVDTSREKGIEEGKIEGRIEGKIEGKIEGRIEGRKEGKIEVAIELKKNKIPVEIIMKSTGLTKEEIENI
ncbi:MAG: hypothetical protein R2828_01460 [Saprospiraceae bacterium]